MPPGSRSSATSAKTQTRGIRRTYASALVSIIAVPQEAAEVSLVITYDIDGSPGAETVSFRPGRRQLRDRPRPAEQSPARRCRGARRPAGRPAAAWVDRAAVRAWARDAGLAVRPIGEPGERSSRDFGVLGPSCNRGVAP